MTESKGDAARRLWRLWEEGQQPDLAEFLSGAGTLEPLDLAGVLRIDQQQRWLLGQRLPAEHYLQTHPRVAADAEASLDIIYAECILRQERGEAVSPAEIQQRFPRFADQLHMQLDFGQALATTQLQAPPLPDVMTEAGGSATTLPAAPTPALPVQQIRCPHCHNPIQLGDTQSDEVLCPGCGGSFRVRNARKTESVTPMRLGKFALLERVGLGAFGAVWRARDTELERIVALKIPHAGLAISPEELQRVYEEARQWRSCATQAS